MLTRLERARQFLPFDALKGLHEALKLKEYEHTRTQKIEVSEEESRKISAVLSGIEKGDNISVVYYSDSDQHYHKIEGIVKPNFIEGYIEIYSTEKRPSKIMIDDIKEIENMG